MALMARRRSEAVAAHGLGGCGRHAGCVARVEMFQAAQASRPLRRVSIRDPCFFQIALNGPKCNGNYAATQGNNVIASGAELGSCVCRETNLQTSGPPTCPYLDY